MFDTVIVPIDLDQVESGKETLALAKKFVSEGGKIILLHAVEDIPLNVASQIPAGALEKTDHLAKVELKKLADEMGIDAETQIRSGSASNVIIDFAEESKADLVIIASHRPGLRDYFLGSTATRVVRHAQCPVFVNR